MPGREAEFGTETGRRAPGPVFVVGVAGGLVLGVIEAGRHGRRARRGCSGDVPVRGVAERREAVGHRQQDDADDGDE
ncbi:hypothetical protein AB0E67_09100 [Streptomyces sp. NPDC032161]|uniref:hypothetical protein n=1 Tax=unclassified Streptomyces TaxID=2593676 RepID=UPI0033EA42F2